MKTELILIALTIIIVSCATLAVLYLQPHSVPVNVINNCTSEIIGNCIIK